MDNTIKHDIALLDFLRGWAAVLVFFHHSAILGGGPSFLSGVIGHEAVNAFMLASGFLIYFQCSISKSYQNLSTNVGIKNFAIRRFFRIAPAYYLCLVLAFILSEYLGQSREAIAQVLPHTMTSMDRYYMSAPIENFFVHITFLFGLIPSYAFSTPLPDWSLGLEMQFYFIFPFIFLLLRKNFAIYLTLLLGGMVFIWLVLRQLEISYPMPSLIALKFHNFAAGIVIAHVLLNKNSNKLNTYLIAVTLFFLVACNKTLLMPALFIFCLWWICFVSPKNKSPVILLFKWLINQKLNKFLAEISYSVYIFHLVLMLPFFAYLLRDGTLTSLLWLIYSCLLLTLVSAVSFLIYKYVELPGISFGKKLISSRNITS
jgi:peptidoglycan/LPS O-acetylase OafA/YrhL